MAAYFEAAVAAGSGQPKLASNWIMGELVAAAQRPGHRDRRGAGRGRPQLAQLIGRIADGTVSNNAARQVFDALWSGERQRRSTPSSRPRASSR